MANFISFYFTLLIFVPTVISFNCFKELCRGAEVCKLEFRGSYIANSSCEEPHRQGHSVDSKCGFYFPTSGKCFCEDPACMQRLYSLTTTLRTSTPTTELTTTFSEKPTQPVCVDIDVRCNSSFYQQILCASKDPSSISLAISKCPKTCNRCDEYFEMLTTPAKTATTTATITNSPTITMPTTATTATKTSSTTTTNLPPITTTPTTTNTPTTTTTPTTTNTPTTTTTTPTPTTTTPTTTTSPTTTTMPTTTTSPTTTTASTTTTTMTKITLPTPASTKLSNAQVTTAQPTCSDQSAKCNDHFFTSFLCANLDPINLEYAIATCPMSCNRCTEYYASLQAKTTTPVPITATTVLGTTTPLECIDRETKCSDTFYQTILCTATDQNSKDYALQTCPKACNLCDKLLGSIDSAFGR